MNRLALLLVVVTLTASAQAAEQPAADQEFFAKKIRPLLADRCYTCHSKQAKKQRGGLLLDSRAGILKGGDSGPVIVPGQPDKSLLIQAIRYGKETLQMPPNGKLPDAEIARLEEWVRRGAAVPDVGGSIAGRSALDLAEGRKFWSFQQPSHQTLPLVQKMAWIQRRMDGFVLAELEKKGLSPATAASKRALVRRLTFDVLGLPPTPEQVEAFVADPAADAYARTVERLLDSPLYGERWGRYWLDLTRYCDVAESWSSSKGQPWAYRDWVVRAINEDLPYDQFVMRQLAADLLPGVEPRHRAALGFLGLSPTYWKELKLDPAVIKTVVAEEWEERIQAVTSTFLGLTVACARCHDHKFDPIRTQDYYALAGVLASIRQTDMPLIPEPLATRAQQARDRILVLQGQIDKLRLAKPITPEVQKQIDERMAQIEQLKKTTPCYDTPLVPAVDEASLVVLADGPHKTKLEYKPGVAQDVTVQVRGNPANAGPVIPRRFLAVLSADPPRAFTQGSGRLELARAIVAEGAPLTARVLVNRIWKHHFGTGLVETPSDFGTQGERPSHPALLDDLTARFIQNGWSIKWLQREILLSATYQQSSAYDERKHALDPDNRLLGRMNRRRLDIEAWRDAMLAVDGSLDLQIGGPPQDLADPQNRRRTIYGTVKRRELTDMLRLYDFPDPTTHSPSRVPTTTPLQQLFVLNSPFIQQQAAALVQRVQAEVPGGGEPRVQRMYELLFVRHASKEQVSLAIEFLGEGKSPQNEALWRQYAQVLLGSNEFLFVD